MSNNIQESVQAIGDKLAEKFGHEDSDRSVATSPARKRAARKPSHTLPEFASGVRAFGRSYPALGVWVKCDDGFGWRDAWDMVDQDSAEGQIMIETLGYVRHGIVRRVGSDLRVLS